MSINLIPGCRGSIQIVDLNTNTLYQDKDIPPEQIKKFITKYGKSKDGCSLLRGLMIPLRTDNLKNFSTDLFSPTFVNYSRKINNVALKIFASILAIVLDIITLPIRLLTTPLQIHYNHTHPEEKHPIMDLIENSPHTQKAIEDNIVSLCYEIETVQLGDPQVEEEHTFQKAVKSVVKGIMQIALKRMPGGVKTQISENKENFSYLGMDGEWTIENSIASSSSACSFAC